MDNLKRYLSDAFRSPSAYVHLPIAPYTTEVNAVLPAQTLSTGRVNLKLPHPSLLIAMEAVVKPTTWDPAFAAQISGDDLRVKVDLSEQSILTLRRETNSTSGGPSGGMVTLSKLANHRRFFMLLLTTDKPDIGFTYTSKYGSGATGIPKDVQIDLVAYYIEKAELHPDVLKEFGR